MRILRIRNLGPIGDLRLELKRINVIIGPQSSGKSCVLKTASYCAWVEKRIELSQSCAKFAEEGFFLQEQVRYHKLDGYVKSDTYIEYSSDFMSFSYDNGNRKFDFSWKEGRWNYRRSQISYISLLRGILWQLSLIGWM